MVFKTANYTKYDIRFYVINYNIRNDIKIFSIEF